MGACGRELCCTSWLKDVRSVNISAARYQKLSLNPHKITGQCGKLKCCLNYELQNYIEAIKNFPNTKVQLKTKKGTASVQKVDIFKRIVWYSYVNASQEWIQVGVQSVEKMLALNKIGNSNFLIDQKPITYVLFF